MSRNFKLFLLIEGVLALSMLSSIVTRPLLLLVIIGSFVVMTLAKRTQNSQLGKIAWYTGVGALVYGAFISGAFALMLIVALIWLLVFGLDELRQQVNRRI
ncbi:hypothetical protein BFC22_09660 [Carnobacterium divergens]|uniref:DUF7649 domain-containing protein n=1 Tax=Carnobacterium divergens TaxID=2748 RepID=UPI000E759342|nr:hypothetical protein [Carnobacterium divergens]AOA00359.1 hypothetical protein BFC22_09660 [Carnobacterium divergens]